MSVLRRLQATGAPITPLSLVPPCLCDTRPLDSASDCVHILTPCLLYLCRLFSLKVSPHQVYLSCHARCFQSSPHADTAAAAAAPSGGPQLLRPRQPVRASGQHPQQRQRHQRQRQQSVRNPAAVHAGWSSQRRRDSVTGWSIIGAAGMCYVALWRLLQHQTTLLTTYFALSASTSLRAALYHKST
jgi:hypothetical protein